MSLGDIGPNISAAQRALSEARDAMIEGLAPAINDPHYATVLVDSILTGLVHHFYEVGSNQKAFEDAGIFTARGGSAQEYVNRFGGQVIDFIKTVGHDVLAGRAATAAAAAAKHRAAE